MAAMAASRVVAARPVAGRRSVRARAAVDVAAPPAIDAAAVISAAAPQCGVLSRAVAAAEAAVAPKEGDEKDKGYKGNALAEALAGCEDGFTVFAPTDAAFKQLLAEQQLTESQLLAPESRELLVGLLKYHVVPKKVPAAELASAGELGTALGEKYGADLRLGVKTVNGAQVVEADLEAAGGGVVHVVDAVLSPPYALPSPITEPKEALAFEGWAPEVVNGRAAMLGFALALFGELSGHGGVLQQFDLGDVVRTGLLWSAASLAPAMHSSIGYQADPKSIKGSDEWRVMMKGGPYELATEVLTADVEMLNGRAAMVGLVALGLVEAAFKGGAALF